MESASELKGLASDVDDILAVVARESVEVTRQNPFGGLLSTTPMTEGSHAVILCRNMKRPCASVALAPAELKRIQALDGKQVRLEVGADGYSLQKASTTNAVPAAKATAPRIKLTADTSVRKPQDHLSQPTATAATVGAKAANYFELVKLLGEERVQPAMAIPFAYYQEFIQRTGLNYTISKSLRRLSTIRDASERKELLRDLRAEFQRQPMPPGLLDEIVGDIESRFKKKSKDELKRLRFRSSSNSEDLKWFSGAGLYESVGLDGDLNGEALEAAIEASIRQVWASVWSDSAFEGRQEAGIDHSTVAMSVLVHPSYSKEAANGVVLTGTGDKSSNYRVSVNFGSRSVTNPELGALPEVYEASRETVVTGSTDPRKRVRSSNVKAGAPVLTPEEAEDLRGLVAKIHDHYGEPMELEFKLMKDPKNPGKRLIQVKQARPYRAQ